MVAIKALTVLALAGATLAVPVANPAPLSVGEALERREAEAWGEGRPNFRWSWRWGGQGERQGSSEGDDAEDTTPTPTPAAQPATATSPPTDYSSGNGQSKGQGPPQGSQGGSSGSDSPASTPAAPSTGSTGGSSSGDTGYMAIVNEWRGKMGLSSLQQDSKLQSNADDAARSANGQLVHKLNPGSMGQVMAPGDSGNFESVFLGGWLCEMPTLPGLGSSVCDAASKGWDHAGQTGHAKILTSPDYSKIGCALETGIWSCDLA